MEMIYIAVRSDVTLHGENAYKRGTQNNTAGSEGTSLWRLSDHDLLQCLAYYKTPDR